MGENIERFVKELAEAKKVKKKDRDEAYEAKNKERKDEIFTLVSAIDRDLPREKFFSEHGHELLSHIFKLTFYGKNFQYSVYNKKVNDKGVLMEVDIEDHETVCLHLKEMSNIESQLNYLVNNILMKQMKAVEDKF